ncbi:MAG: hypothetical protein WC942_12125 [Clostridia bacterium]|jgi:hypothetical protein
MNIDIHFNEFGDNLEFKPNILNVQKYFPEAKIKIFREVEPSLNFDKTHERYGNRVHNYYSFKNALESNADIVFSLDADMYIVNEKVKAITVLAQKFGICVTMCNRYLVGVDTKIGSDSDKQIDDTLGTFSAMNPFPMAINTKDERARKLASSYLELYREKPLRASLVLWRAIYKTGIVPCLLPMQWCVCGGSEGIGNEIILHIGHEKVRRYYGEKLGLSF